MFGRATSFGAQTSTDHAPESDIHGTEPMVHTGGQRVHDELRTGDKTGMRCGDGVGGRTASTGRPSSRAAPSTLRAHRTRRADLHGYRSSTGSTAPTTTTTS